ncbi:hypothetical protein T484DRAFT_1812993 [Baffinella frigidus]|nr:hypothetical protein T484DRAFT_1812993 [Cryptophyta sp. CCMP2293]
MFPNPVPEWFLVQHACGQSRAVPRPTASTANKEQDLPSRDATCFLAMREPAASDQGSAAVKASSGFSRLSLADVSEEEVQPASNLAGASGSFGTLKMLSIGVNGFKPRGESASDPSMRLFRQAAFDASVRNLDGRLPLALRRLATIETIHTHSVPQAPSPSPAAEPVANLRRTAALKTIHCNNVPELPEPAAESCFEAGDEPSTRTRFAAGPRSAHSTPACRPARRGSAPLLAPTTAHATHALSSVSLPRGASQLLRPRTAAPRIK